MLLEEFRKLRLVYRDERIEMPKCCSECPFVTGTALNLSLGAERLSELKWGIVLGKPFHCHKTKLSHRDTEFVDDGEGGEIEEPWAPHYRLCKGAIEWATR